MPSHLLMVWSMFWLYLFMGLLVLVTNRSGRLWGICCVRWVLAVLVMSEVSMLQVFIANARLYRGLVMHLLMMLGLAVT